MSYTIKSYANEVCNLTMTDRVENDDELNKFFSIMQRTATVITGKNHSWSKIAITKDVDVYTMSISDGRMYIFYVIKED